MAIDADALRASLDGLVRLVPTDLTLDDALQQVVNALHGLFRLTGAGLLLVDGEQTLRCVAASDSGGALLEQVQVDLGQGPCIDTYLYDRLVASRDLGTDERYRLAGPQLADAGVHAVAGVPVRIAGAPVGALNVYVDTTHTFGEDETSALEGYARVLEQLLLAGLAAHRSGVLVEQLQHALDYRVLIERGIGYLMARDGQSATEAFQRLRAVARRRRRKVIDLARDLLDGVPVPDLD